MIWNPDQASDRDSIMAEKVLAWAEETIAIVSKVQDHTIQPQAMCIRCRRGVEVVRGRHSGCLFVRHPRIGCTPGGSWDVIYEKP